MGARLFRQGVEIDSSGEQGEQEQTGAIRLAVAVSETCPRCARERKRRVKTFRVVRYWYREARELRRHVRDLEDRFGITAGAPPDAQLAAMTQTVNRLREKLADQEKRFRAANDRNGAQIRYHQKGISTLKRALDQARAEIARLNGSPP
jgi:hypothetical protein